VIQNHEKKLFIPEKPLGIGWNGSGPLAVEKACPNFTDRVGHGAQSVQPYSVKIG
jgi:hypothetical protein